MTKLTTNQRKQAKKVIPFQQEYNCISPQDLEDILETLEDYNYLNENGKDFRTAFWNLFIREDK